MNVRRLILEAFKDLEVKGKAVYMLEAFGINSGKSPNFGRIKAIALASGTSSFHTM